MNNFNKIIDRRRTWSLKYDAFSQYGKNDGLIPMWVADMDFQTADPIRERIRACADHGIFGYSSLPDEYFEAVNLWFSSNFNFTVDKSWIVPTPGVVFALAAAIRSFSSEDDGVIVNQPVYYPFSNLIINNKRKLVNSELVLEDGHYRIDFEDFEKKIVENDVKMYLLCSPHNPVGRVWTKDELLRLADICLKHGVLVVSDEIHCDFVWSEHHHTVFASLGEKYAENCIVCTAPSKSFNIAGLQASNIIIPNKKLRHDFRKTIFDAGYFDINNIGAAACEAAYREGKPWLDELRTYLRTNISFAREYINNEIPGVKLIEPEGTYLLWLDFRELTLTEEGLEKLIDDAGLWLDTGSIFGPSGIGFQRINAACPLSVLKQALAQLKTAVKELSLECCKNNKI